MRVVDLRFLRLIYRAVYLTYTQEIIGTGDRSCRRLRASRRGGVVWQL